MFLGHTHFSEAGGWHMCLWVVLVLQLYIYVWNSRICYLLLHPRSIYNSANLCKKDKEVNIVIWHLYFYLVYVFVILQCFMYFSVSVFYFSLCFTGSLISLENHTSFWRLIFLLFELYSACCNPYSFCVGCFFLPFHSILFKLLYVFPLFFLNELCPTTLEIFPVFPCLSHSLFLSFCILFLSIFILCCRNQTSHL